jgi:antitoxin component YwqK of YwqJK toxin-antitoxin module
MATFTCQICIENKFAENEIKRYCPDERHTFCIPCFADWVKSCSPRVHCPICRTDLFIAHPGWVEDGLGTTFFENGEKKSECMYVMGLRHGVFKEYNLQGSLVKEETYEMGILHGPSRTWFETGLLFTETFYEKGKMSGPSAEWYQSGQLKCVSTYQDDIKHGPYLTYHENGHKSIESFFMEGEIHGIVQYWYSCGNRWTESLYEKGKKVYEKIWSRTGVLLRESNEYTVEDDEKSTSTGIIKHHRVRFEKRWFPDGSPKSEIYYGNVREGISQEWKQREGADASGSYLWIKCYYKDGLLHGPYQEFNEAGEVVVDRVYKMNQVVERALSDK